MSKKILSYVVVAVLALFGLGFGVSPEVAAGSVALAFTAVMKLPAGVAAGTSVVMPDGSVVNSTNRGLLSVDTKFLQAMLAAGFTGLPESQFAVDADNTAHEVSVNNVSGAKQVTLNMTGNLAAGRALTLPTVAAMLAALPGLQVGDTFCLRVINSSAGAFAWTMTTNTGWTLTGTMTIAQNTFRDFQVSLDSAAAMTLQQLGTGATS